MSTPVVPFVRKLIPCLKVELTGEGADRRYVLTEPLTVIDQPDTRGDVAVFALLTGGLGTTEVQLEVRHTVDDQVYRTVGWSQVVEVEFNTQTRGVSTLNLHFRLRNLSMKIPGMYEFRMTSGSSELPGERADIRVLSKTM